MTTSGVTTFDPEFDDVLQDAAAMVGGGPILAEELISAKRGLNNLLISMQNRNVLLHKIETTTVNVSVSASFFTLDNSIVDVLGATVRTSATDARLNMDRDGYERFNTIPVPNQQGRPLRFWYQRNRTDGIFNMWPVPDQTYELSLVVHKKAEDCVRATDSIDVPTRFLPAVTYGIAYWMGLHRNKAVPAERLQLIKANYEEELRNALNEDRERGPFLLRIGVKQ